MHGLSTHDEPYEMLARRRVASTEPATTINSAKTATPHVEIVGTTTSIVESAPSHPASHEQVSMAIHVPWPEQSPTLVQVGGA